MGRGFHLSLVQYKLYHSLNSNSSILKHKANCLLFLLRSKISWPISLKTLCITCYQDSKKESTLGLGHTKQVLPQGINTWKSVRFRDRKPGLESELCLLHMWPQASHLTSLVLSLYICKIKDWLEDLRSSFYKEKEMVNYSSIFAKKTLLTVLACYSSTGSQNVDTTENNN